MHPWRNWQTRMVQVHIFERKCRFNSCRVHHEKPDFIGLFLIFHSLNRWQMHNPTSQSCCILYIKNRFKFSVIYQIRFLRLCVCQINYSMYLLSIRQTTFSTRTCFAAINCHFVFSFYLTTLSTDKPPFIKTIFYYIFI